MTLHADIIGSDFAPAGWVETDPFDYNYTGPDPDGRVEAYLSGIDDGTIKFYWPQENDKDDSTEYPPDLTLLRITKRLDGFDSIWYTDLASDFETTTITYGE